jgi:capsid portal protein
MSNTKTKERANVSFLAIDPYVETHIVSPQEKKLPGKDFVEWGTNNLYPEYLIDLYNNVATLKSVIDGCVDFIVGNDVTILPIRPNMDGVMNAKGDTIVEQVKDLAHDEEKYGGFALQVIRGKDGKPSEVYYIDMRFLRTNKECDVFFYCEDWKRSGRKKVVVYPKFMPSVSEKWATMTDEERNSHASSILFVKSIRTQVYPSPRYAASVKSCEIERCIDDFHLNAINNGFTGSYVINFNNGKPTPEVMEEIEDNFNEKFSGHQNAGRIAFSWNENRTTATTIEQVQVQDFGEKYKSLENTSRQRIFTAFRANPNLFGIPTENLGFSSEEYESAFRLFNRTHVRPIQKKIADAYDKIYGQKGVLTIVPFSMDEESVKDEIVK